MLSLNDILDSQLFAEYSKAACAQSHGFLTKDMGEDQEMSFL